jgi:hypothetical protein
VPDRICTLALLTALWLASCGWGGKVYDLDGAQVDPLSDREGITVLVFASRECPISNRYAPELKRIAQTQAGHGVRFWLVYPDAHDDAAEIRAHTEAFDYGMRALRDPQHVLVKRAGVRVTPEVAVFTRTGDVAYRGRIDDRYVRLGQEQPSAQTHDLEDALIAVLRGQAVRAPTTAAVGCAISD